MAKFTVGLRQVYTSVTTDLRMGYGKVAGEYPQIFGWVILHLRLFLYGYKRFMERVLKF